MRFDLDLMLHRHNAPGTRQVAGTRTGYAYVEVCACNYCKTIFSTSLYESAYPCLLVAVKALKSFSVRTTQMIVSFAGCTFIQFR